MIIRPPNGYRNPKRSDLIGRFKGTGVSEASRNRAKKTNEYRSRQLNILRDITLAITSTLELDAVLNTLLEKIDLLLPCAAFTVRLFDEHGKLEPLACRNIDIEDCKAAYGAGVVKEVLERKVPVMSVDVQPDPRSRRPAFFREYGFVSFLAIPLIVKEKIIGVLSVHTKTRYSFSREEIEFLTTLAGHAAIAIHNSRLYEQTKRLKAANGTLLRAYEKQVSEVKAANQFLSALHSISSIASRSLDLDAVLNEVIKKLTEIFGFDITRIFLLDRNTKQLSLAASSETRPDFYTNNKVLQLGQGIIGTVAKTGQRIMFKDVSRDPRYHKLSHSKTNIKAGLYFLAVFPIKTKSITVGCIDFSSQKPRQLTRKEILLIRSMISQIAVALENSNLFNAIRKKVEELSALYSLARVVSSSLNFEVLLRRIMDEVLTMFKFQAGKIYLYDSDTKELKVLASRGLRRVPKIRGPVRHVIEKQRPLFFGDFQNDARYRMWSKNRIAIRKGFRSGFFLPIKCKGNIVGMIRFFSRKVHQFSATERQLIDLIAKNLGPSIENSQLYEAMKRSRQQLQNLAERMQLAREEERARLARHLHDELGQSLAALKMEVDTITTGSLVDSKLKEQSKNQAFCLIDGMVNTVRRMTKTLRPTILDDVDLTGALELHTSEFQQRTGVQCRIKSNIRGRSLDKLRATALLRIFQEALSNVQRHSGADRVDIEWTQAHSGVTLKIHDNGKGIRQEALRHAESLGIVGMRERAVLCGGTLEVRGGRGSGTTVRAYIPSHSVEAQQ